MRLPLYSLFKKIQTNEVRQIHLDHTEHGLGHVEGMSPVMVGDISVVLLHTQQPSA